MINKIPILTPQDARHFFTYFSGVAITLAKRFALGFHPDEEHLTSLLCELMDNRGAALHSLEYGIEQLNRDLNASGSILRTTLSLETRTYSKHQERYSTQSDMGIVLDYRDNVEPSLSFRKALLIQAKKLFPSRNGQYTLSSEYSSFDPDQHHRLISLRKSYDDPNGNLLHDQDKEMMRMRQHELNDDALLYLLFNPTLFSLPDRDQERVVHSQLSKDTKKIYDYTHGLFLHESLNGATPSSAILSISSLFATLNMVHSWARGDSEDKNDTPEEESLHSFDLDAVVKGCDIREMSFAWYLVFRFILGDSGSQYPEFVSLAEGRTCPPKKDMPVLPPRYVLRVMIEAGTNPEKHKS